MPTDRLTRQQPNERHNPSRHGWRRGARAVRAVPGRQLRLGWRSMLLMALVYVVFGWHEPADIIGGAFLAHAVHHAVSAVRMRRGH